MCSAWGDLGREGAVKRRMLSFAEACLPSAEGGARVAADISKAQILRLEGSAKSMAKVEEMN